MKNFLSLVKFEYKKIFSSKFNLIFLSIATVALIGIITITIFGELYAVSASQEEGNYDFIMHNGLDAIKTSRDEYTEIKGELSEDKIYEILSKGDNDHFTSAIGGASSELTSICFINYLLEDNQNLTDKEKAEIYYQNYKKHLLDNFRNIKEDYTDKTNYKPVNEIQLTESQLEIAQKIVDDVETPFHFDYKGGYVAFHQIQITIAFLVLVLIGVFSTSIFNKEYSLKTDAILLSTKKGKNSLALVKIVSVSSIAVILLLAFTFLTFIYISLTYGLSGGNVLISFYWNDVQPITWLVATITSISLMCVVCVGFSAFCSMLSSLIKNQIGSMVIAMLVVVIPLLSERFLFTIFRSNIIVEKITQSFPTLATNINGLFDYKFYNILGMNFTTSQFTLVLYIIIIAICVPITYIKFNKYRV